MSRIDPNIVQLIEEHPDKEFKDLAKMVRKQFGVMLPQSAVLQVRGHEERVQRINDAKDRASESLDDKLTLMDEVAAELLEIFRDDTVPMKERIAAAKELRSWTGMSIDTSGINDDEGQAVFVLSGEWQF